MKYAKYTNIFAVYLPPQQEHWSWHKWTLWTHLPQRGWAVEKDIPSAYVLMLWKATFSAALFENSFFFNQHLILSTKDNRRKMGCMNMNEGQKTVIEKYTSLVQGSSLLHDWISPKCKSSCCCQSFSGFRSSWPGLEGLLANARSVCF